MLGTAVSHYRIIGKLGSGGMGVVYEAEDSRLPRRVALKFLSEELASDADAARRFAREAATIALLSHPNICTIFEIDSHDGRQFIAMEKLDGVSLKTYMSRQSLSTPEVAHLALQITDALDAAHQKGIVHRDIKPGNVVVSDAGHVKVLDFGLARRFRLADDTEGVGLDGIDAAGPAAGDRQLHGARADPADAAGSAQRSVLVGGRDVRDGHRPAAVCRRLARRHGDQRAGPRAAAADLLVEPLQAAGEGGDAAPRQGRGRPVSVGGHPAVGPRAAGLGAAVAHGPRVAQAGGEGQ